MKLEISHIRELGRRSCIVHRYTRRGKRGSEKSERRRERDYKYSTTIYSRSKRRPVPLDYKRIVPDVAG